MESQLLRPEEAAEWLNVGRSKIYQLMRAGELESIQIGTCRRIPRAALIRYVERLSQTVRTA